MKKILILSTLLIALFYSNFANHIVYTDLRKAIEHPKEVYILDLSNQSYSTFPMEILQMENLHELILTNTRLTYLPDDLSKLKHLKVLRVQNNPIRQLPVTIVQLIHLRVLDLRETDIVKIPHISRLNHLVELDISHTLIKTVPRYFSKFPHLKHLEIAGLKLTHLMFTEYKHLHYLDISHNNFEKLPADLKELTHLHSLIMTDLKQLKQIPLWVFEFPHLHYLDISRNNANLFTKEHWGHLSSDRHLKGLYLSNINLENLAMNWAGLKHLEELDLSGNPMINYANLMTALKTTSLKKLNFSGNRLTNIDFRHFTHLTELDISGNKFSIIPFLPNQLQILNLEKNQLKNISTSITDLIKIEELYLANNQIQDIKLLFDLPLQKLSIHHNPLSKELIKKLRIKQPLCNIE